MNGVNYTFDDNGNLLRDGVNTYVYDSANRLISVNGTETYTYNGLGDRLTQNGTQYVLDLNAGLTQVLSDRTNSYLYGNGRISQTGSVTEYFLGDALGSVRQLTDPNGEITLAKSYNPYGNVTLSSGDGTSPFAYTGEQQDASGLTYLRARYYSSGDGRFLSRDTWGGDYNSPLSLNRWNYTHSNPINRIDPSGQCYIDTGSLPNRRPWEWEWKVLENPLIGPCPDLSGPISPDKPFWHEYRSNNLVCSAWLNCSRNEVVDALSRFAFPGQNPFKPVQPGELSFVAPFSWFPGVELGGTPVPRLGAIRSLVFSNGLHVRNVSEPTHIFHKGQVDRQAKQVGKSWYVVTHGTGNNIYLGMHVVNQVTGAEIFTGVDTVMRQYLESMRIINLIKGLDC